MRKTNFPPAYGELSGPFMVTSQMYMSCMVIVVGEYIFMFLKD